MASRINYEQAYGNNVQVVFKGWPGEETHRPDSKREITPKKTNYYSSLFDHVLVKNGQTISKSPQLISRLNRVDTTRKVNENGLTPPKSFQRQLQKIQQAYESEIASLRDASNKKQKELEDLYLSEVDEKKYWKQLVTRMKEDSYLGTTAPSQKPVIPLHISSTQYELKLRTDQIKKLQQQNQYFRNSIEDLKVQLKKFKEENLSMQTKLMKQEQAMRNSVGTSKHQPGEKSQTRSPHRSGHRSKSHSSHHGSHRHQTDGSTIINGDSRELDHFRHMCRKQEKTINELNELLMAQKLTALSLKYRYC